MHHRGSQYQHQYCHHGIQPCVKMDGEMLSVPKIGAVAISWNHRRIYERILGLKQQSKLDDSSLTTS